MRGDDVRTESAVFSYVSCEARVPQDHPLRPIRTIVDEALTVLSPEFDELYSDIGRPSIPPEKLLRALLLQAFYSVRSERQLMEQLDYNLLFRWFVGLAMDAPIWDVTVFTKNRDRLLEGDVAAQFFQAVLGQPEVRALLSDEHFSVDGTLIEAWASMKSFQPKAEAGRRGRRRGRRAQRRARLPRRAAAQRHARLDHRSRRPAVPQGPGKEAKLCLSSGHAADGEPQRPDRRRPGDPGHRHRRARGRAGHARPRKRGRHRATLGADKAYDAAGFVADLRALHVTPHVAQNTHQPPLGDRRAERRATPATRSASASASGSRRASAGSRRWAACARPATAAPNGSAGCSR